MELLREPEIHYITKHNLQNDSFLEKVVYPNMRCNYYWSNNFSKEFYIDLAYAGFITITTEDSQSNLLLLPEIEFAYSILDFKNLHISKKVKSLIKKGGFRFSINQRFYEVLEAIANHHNHNWLYGKYEELLEDLYRSHKNKKDFRVISVEVICSFTGKLIAGEVGYIIGRTYTSLTGFSSKEKIYRNYGNLQMVLLSKLLEKNGFAFWNLGQPYMEYKNSLGAKIYTREEFLKRWKIARDEKLPKLDYK
ncbi:Leucyl/phenylalanyl-tRNA--protein transferase [hydrothermal vent metagenome]|uniref:Leucyl/phenylalanyl-tRNA--protein transferase n=1 Tax=hydrothermal vent metagenome TaxID=652676 RepID=A0A1W1EI98_9ZZZZ